MSSSSSSSMTSSISNLTFINRFGGMIFGVMIGDALGIPHEFARVNPKLEYTGIINTEHELTIQWQWAKTIIPPASVSDDSLMTLALLEDLLENKFEYNPETVALAYMKFANTPRVGLGRNTRKLFHGVKTWKGYQARFKKHLKEIQECESNGCLMRTSPLILVDRHVDDNENIRPSIHESDCLLSNPNDVCIDAVLIYHAILDHIYSGYSKENIKDMLIKAIKDEKISSSVRTAISQALESNPTRDISGKTKGWVCHCLFAAVHAFLKYDTMEEAMKWIITQPNTDSDTNASVCGSLFGAYLGINGIEQEKMSSKNLEIIRTKCPEGIRAIELLDKLANLIM